MSKYNRTHVIQKILEATETGAPESKIRSSTFLSFTEVDVYLDKMVKNGLIRYDRHTRTYETTSVGKEFLETIKQIGSFFNGIGE